MQDAAVKNALRIARDSEPRTIQQQIQVCEIPAPPFNESVRGRDIERRFKELRLANVRTDAVGNVIGVRPGAAARPNIVMSAHLDTVFPEGTSVKVTREGNRLKGPGIGDDCRGLAVLLAVIESLNAAHVVTPGTITFVATVGEEGLGDLRGAKALFEEMAGQIDKFVSIDGNGLDIVNVGVGSMRYKVIYQGPGGHSYGNFGIANPIHALGRAIAKISDFEVPASPKTTFNVGRIGGGTSVNSIASEAWMEVDLRSADVGSLKTLDESCMRPSARRSRKRTAGGIIAEGSMSQSKPSAIVREARRPLNRRSRRPLWQSRGRLASRRACAKDRRMRTSRCG